MTDPPATPKPGMGSGGARAALLAIGGLALLFFVTVVMASYRRSHDLGGLLTGLFTGLFAALLFAAAGVWMLISLLSPKQKKALDLEKASELERLLAPTLSELEAARAETVRRVNARMTTRLPLGLAAGIGLWMVSQLGRHPGGFFDLVLFGGFGGLVGYYWASHKLSDQYRRLYKGRVLPQLAAQFGALNYRSAVTPDLGQLAPQRIFRQFDRVVAEDEIFGAYRGMTVSIVELRLTNGSGKSKQTVFDGLLTKVDLPRKLSGTTAVIADNGVLGNLKDRFECEGRARVRVEDPQFEKIYEVYGTDQVGARALLTPAFMERFLALGERAGFTRPLALAQDNRLTIALPKIDHHDLFEPPSYRQPAKSQELLLKLYGDIAAVLRAADTVIDLDQASRAVAASATAYREARQNVMPGRTS